MNNEKYPPEGYRIGTAENRAYTGSLSGLERAMETGAICEAPAVMCDSEDYSLRVELGGAVELDAQHRTNVCGNISGLFVPATSYLRR